MKEIDSETRTVIAKYSGTVTRYPPGKARGEQPIKEKVGRDYCSAASWQAPPPDQVEQRRQQRMQRAQRQRITKRNAAIRHMGTPK
jgi:hypothetical protein